MNSSLVSELVAQAPLTHLTESDGGDVFEAQADDKRWVAQRIHLLNLKRVPEDNGSELNNHADGGEGHPQLTSNLWQALAIAQQQRNRDHREQLHGRGNVAIAPRIVTTPTVIPGIKKDVSPSKQEAAMR